MSMVKGCPDYSSFYFYRQSNIREGSVDPFRTTPGTARLLIRASHDALVSTRYRRDIYSIDVHYDNLSECSGDYTCDPSDAVIKVSRVLVGRTGTVPE